MIGLGGSSLMGIGLAVTLQDSFTKPAAAVNASMMQMSGNSQKLANANASMASSIATGTVAAGAAIIYGLGKSVQAFAQYDYALTKTKLIAGMTGQEMEVLRLKSESLATTYGISIDQIMESNVALAKAGVSGGALAQMSEAIVTLSKSADEPASEMGDKLINMMMQFGIASKNSQHFADELTQAANKSTIDVKDMFQSISYAGATAHNLRIPFEQVATQIAMIGNAGIKGSSGGTQLANMYRYLAQSVSEFPLKRQQEALKALKIDPRQLMDSHGNLKDMGQMIDLFTAKTKGMSSTRVQNLTNLIFGPRGSRAFIALMSQGRTAYDKMYDDITYKSQGLAKGMALKLSDTPEGKYQKMLQELNLAVKDIGRALAPLASAIMPVVTGIVHMFRAIVNNPVGKVLLWIGTAFVVIRTATAAVRLAQLGYNATIQKTGSSATNMAKNFAWATGSMKSNLWQLIRMQNTYNSSVNNTRMRFNPGTVINGRNVGGQFMGRNPGGLNGLALAGSAWQMGTAANSFGFLRGMVTTFGSMARPLVGVVSGLGSMAEFFLGPWGMVIGAVIALAPALDGLGDFGRAIHAVVTYIETLLTTFSFEDAYKEADRIMDHRNKDGSYDKERSAKPWGGRDDLGSLIKNLGGKVTVNVTVDGKKTTQDYMTNHENHEVNSILNL